MKSLRIGLVLLVGFIVVLGVYWRSQTVSSVIKGREDRKNLGESDGPAGKLIRKAKTMAEKGNRAAAARVLEKRANQLDASFRADQLRLEAVKYRLLDYVQADGKAAPLNKLAGKLLDESSPDMKQIAYRMSGDIYAFTGEYDRLKKTFQQYLRRYPPLSEKEMQQYRNESRSPVDDAPEGKPDIPPRMEQRADFKRRLKRLKLIDRRAPQFEVTTLKGKNLSPSDFQGDTLLLHFWAAWSKPSRKRMARIRSVYKTYHNAGLHVISLSVDDTREELTDYLNERDLAWPQVRLQGRLEKDVLGKYEVQSIPAMFLIGPEGRIRAYGRALVGKGLDRMVKPLVHATRN